jgi:hypothetical protein
MKSKTSNAIDDLANIKLNKIRELSLVNPNLKSTVVMVREKVHEFNTRYYRPSEGDDIHNLYGDVIDFDKIIDDIFEENLPRRKENHIKVLVTSKPQVFKFKIKDHY